MAMTRIFILNQIKNLYANTQRAAIRQENQLLLKRSSKKAYKYQLNTTRLFSTSSRNDAIPPLLWLIFKPVSKLSAILVGRGFRKWWTNLPQVKRHLFMDHLKRNKIRYALIVSSSTIGSVVYYNAHIQETPITHRKRFIIFSTSHLSEIENLEKDQVFITYEKNILNLYSPYTNRALKVANRLFTANKELPEVSAINWKLTVIDADVCNAAAFPSGDLVVFTGLLDFVENDDELAIILAHEMSHAILSHAAEEISHSRLIDISSIALAGLVWAFLPSDLTALITQYLADKFLKFVFELPYSRRLEKEADEVGLSLAARACFDVRYSSEFWKRMNESEGELPEILSTHPASDTRAIDLEALMPMALQLRKECKCYELPKSIEISKKKFVKKIQQNENDIKT